MPWVCIFGKLTFSCTYRTCLMTWKCYNPSPSAITYNGEVKKRTKRLTMKSFLMMTAKYKPTLLKNNTDYSFCSLIFVM